MMSWTILMLSLITYLISFNKAFDEKTSTTETSITKELSGANDYIEKG